MKIDKDNYIFAFDLSLSCSGITIFSNDGTPVLVTSIDTKSEKETSGKLKLIADKVLELKDKYKTNLIVLENGFTRFNTSTQQIYRVHGLINYLFWDIEQIYYAPTTVKKVVGGRGNMDKKEIRDVVMSKYSDVEFKNYDESDSFSVGLCYFMKRDNTNL
jgi:Holliday junction resolvasome RuvABC endonuclease subunit